MLALTEAAVNEIITHDDRLAVGMPAIQESVHDLERTARTLRNFQPGIIPGLLQTAEYARRVMTLANPTRTDIPQAVAKRLDRQQRLYEQGRSQEFLVTEAALRFRPGPGEDILTAQLDHLAAVVTLSTISFGVIPLDAEMHAVPVCAFILYEDRIDGRPPFARVETPHATLSASDPADVKTYQAEFERFRRSAVYGAEAIDIVRSIAHPK